MTSSQELNFLIIDGYSKKSREDLEKAGMKFAWKLYELMLIKFLPKAEFDVLLPSDDGVKMPSDDQLAKYCGVIWTGCNLCINDIQNPSVRNQIELAKRVYEVGIPSWGSCWGIQMAVVAAGGEVVENPKGREMGLARKIILTTEGKNHPMYQGKPAVFDAYISHDDMVSKLPSGATMLASNDFTYYQALEVRHKKGVFWATQYHPEYDLHEMACLMIAREEKLTKIGYFQDHDNFTEHIQRFKALSKAPDTKYLRWQLAVDDDVLNEAIRQCEFKNWINNLVLPSLG